MGNIHNKSARSGANGADSGDAEAMKVFNLTAPLFTEAKKYSSKIKDFANFHSIVDEINEIQPTVASLTPDEPTRKDAIRPFQRWCKQRGIHYNGLAIDEKPEAGLGLFAAEPVPASHLVIAVPNSQMLNSRDAYSEFGSIMDAAKIDHCWLQVPLALKLINERLSREVSPWRPYIDILPKFIPHPIFFTPSDFGILQGSPCYEEGMNLFYEIASQYSRLYRELYARWGKGVRMGNLTPTNFTFEIYRWGVTIALTRSLKISSDDGSGLTVLVPYWDLCNNGEEALYTRVNVQMGNAGEQYLAAYAMRDLAKGEHLHICYRESSTPVEYFTIWGLALVEYFAPIKVKVSAIDRNYLAKSSYLQKLQGRSCPIDLKIHSSTVPLNYEDLQALLIISATSQDIRTGKVSIHTWRRAWSHMIKRLQKRLSMYSYEGMECDDVSGVSSPQSFLAMNQVVAEKQTLSTALTQCETLLDHEPEDVGYIDFLEPLTNGPTTPAQSQVEESVATAPVASLVERLNHSQVVAVEA